MEVLWVVRAIAYAICSCLTLIPVMRACGGPTGAVRATGQRHGGHADSNPAGRKPPPRRHGSPGTAAGSRGNSSPARRQA